MIVAPAVTLAVTLALGGTGTVLPGLLDLPLVDGSRPSPECLGLRDRLVEAGSPFDCVETSYAAANDIAFAYVRAAGQAGWTSDGGAASALWLRRTTADGRCQRLTVAAFPDPHGGDSPRTAAVILVLDPEVRCPRPTPAP